MKPVEQKTHTGNAHMAEPTKADIVKHFRGQAAMYRRVANSFKGVEQLANDPQMQRALVELEGSAREADETADKIENMEGGHFFIPPWMTFGEKPKE